MSGYSTQQVADLIGIKPDRIRHYVRRKLLRPARSERGHYRFSFQDVVLLRTAKGMTDAAISIRQTNRALAKLQTDLKSVSSLSSVRIYAHGNAVVVREDDNVWEVESGQMTIDFGIQALAADVAQLARDSAGGGKPPEQLDSDEWYNLGLDLEEVDPEQAPHAYKQAVRLDPENADAHVNLGRLYQLAGDLRLAKHHYECALAVRVDHELANYNLGTIFDELEQRERAADFYQRAPAVPDAHYNLARIRELEGDELNAKRHLRQYQRLVELELF
ncbi:MAG: MerR family transcriptional regulator [Pseudomonadota bacterium]|nr:MerR family transcriptional regulator [Pseudomonadota bacterium]